ncbi:MAG: GNAT family N-acetyltransferase [Rhodobacter sp.]|nr:GNAT family N-acetyltransferase [Rhodobacter sp.]
MALLSLALEKLSDDLGDRHHAGADDLAVACHGPHPGCHGFLAVTGGVPVGAALVSPVFSTTKGTMGVYVSDLWVTATLRGKGLGRRLLREVAMFGADRWSATFLKLTVYADNAQAREFYEYLGFRIAEKDQSFLLAGAELDALTGAAL